MVPTFAPQQSTTVISALEKAPGCSPIDPPHPRIEDNDVIDTLKECEKNENPSQDLVAPIQRTEMEEEALLFVQVFKGDHRIVRASQEVEEGEEMQETQDDTEGLRFNGSSARTQQWVGSGIAALHTLSTEKTFNPTEMSSMMRTLGNDVEDEDMEETEESIWLSDSSVNTSISTNTSSPATSSSAGSQEGSTVLSDDESDPLASITITDVYMQAVRDSIAGYPLSMKDVFAIEELMKQLPLYSSHS